MNDEPEDEYIDDLTVAVPPGRTVEELVDFILAARERAAPHAEVMRTLVDAFQLHHEDARLALDRVEGGLVRAATGNPENLPGIDQDPVAHIACQRAWGVPPSPIPPRESDAWRQMVGCIADGRPGDARTLADASDLRDDEREAAALWIGAQEIQPTIPATRAATATRLLALADATPGDHQDERYLQLLQQVGTAIGTVAAARIAALEEEDYGCAQSGTPTWFDAVTLSEAARRLADRFAQAGYPKSKAEGLHLWGYVTTNLLGQCPDRVGAAMLAGVAFALEAGDTEQAAGLCEAVVEDFAVLVPQCEAEDAPLLEEDALALEHLVVALDHLGPLQGGLTPERTALRRRARALLERTA